MIAANRQSRGLSASGRVYREMIRPLCAELQKVATEELDERPERIQEEIEDLRKWITYQPHLNARTDRDQLLLTFLRGCKHNMQKTREKIDAFYTIRSASPELFKDRDIHSARIKEVLRLGVGVPLPKTSWAGGPRILLIRPGAYDAGKFTFIETIKVGMMVQDVQYLEDDHMSVAGDLGIIDLAKVTAGHFFQITPAALKKVLLLKQEGSPLRQKGFHFINIPPGFETLARMARKLLTEKNRDRIVAHSNIETLYDYIPKELLPQEYGGSAGTIAQIIGDWEKKLLEYREYLLEESQFGTVESKREVPSNVAESLYGLSGVFKQLDFD